jgi:phage tail sheath gpL-like
MFDGLSKRYQTVIFDSATNFDLIETWLQSRINMSNTVKGGQGITMMNGTYSEVKDFCNNKNSQSITVIGNVDTMKFNALPILAVAEVGAIRALRLTDGAIIGSYVLDEVEAYGGINKSSLPYHNTPLSYDDPINKIEIEEVQDLNDAGVTLFIPATVGVVLGSVKTLYKYDLSGIEDKTFRYLNAMDTSLAIQEYLYANSQKKFGQTRATGGDLVEGVSMTNELSVKAYIVSLYSDLVDMALAQGGAEAIKAFKKNLTVSLDSASGTYSVYAPTPIVSQFRGMNMTVAISYDIKS